MFKHFPSPAVTASFILCSCNFFSSLACFQLEIPDENKTGFVRKSDLASMECILHGTHSSLVSNKCPLSSFSPLLAFFWLLLFVVFLLHAWDKGRVPTNCAKMLLPGYIKKTEEIVLRNSIDANTSWKFLDRPDRNINTKTIAKTDFDGMAPQGLFSFMPREGLFKPSKENMQKKHEKNANWLQITKVPSSECKSWLHAPCVDKTYDSHGSEIPRKLWFGLLLASSCCSRAYSWFQTRRCQLAPVMESVMFVRLDGHQFNCLTVWVRVR